MSRRPRVQAPPPPPCPWPAFAAASAPCTEPLVADSTESNRCTASMESMSITPPTGWWNPFVPAQGTGSFPAMPQKESSVYLPGDFLSYFNNSPNPHLFHNVAPPPSLTRGSPPSSDVNSCDENEDCRSGKRLTWTTKEDERLELTGEAPRVQYTVNDRQYNTGYYLVDGIYPEWAAFIKSIPLPQTAKDKLFAEVQEGARKDIERAFGVLQSRFAIMRRPAR